MMIRVAALTAMLIPLGACAGTYSSDACPAVSMEKDAKHHAAYPGGVPGNSLQDYKHIAVLTSGTAVCHSDGAGHTVADVTVTYALESGIFYDGTAENEVFAALSQDGGHTELHRVTSKKTVHPVKGQEMDVTDTISGLVISGGDAAKTAGYDIIIGFVLSQGEIDYNKAHPKP